MPKHVVLLFLAAIICVVGCATEHAPLAVLSRNRELERAAAERSETASAPEKAGPDLALFKAPASPPVAAVEPRKVVYTGAFTLLVADMKAAAESTRRMAEQMGGYMQQMTGGSMVIRVPAARFDEAVAGLGDIGTVTDKEVKAQDVTEECEDLAIRLKSAKALLERLLTLLAKADNVKDAIEVEREVNRVRTEIEKLEGQINRLSTQIAYATLSVRFTQTREAPRELKVSLPFPWLRDLGLEHLLSIVGM
ncbi:MAG: DUF4349 domain-containing protein [Planctomycetota bacterium]|nr:DUF4349 domain-containing protein [Planctomycetota bacterium]